MNTINNVPRELLEEVMLAAQRMPVRGPSIRAKLHALLSAPSPAGVDGLEVFAWSEFDGEGGHELRLYENNETFLTDWLARNGDKYADWVEPLCRLSAALAAIAVLDARIVELEADLTGTQSRVLSLQNQWRKLDAELAAIKAQEPVAYIPVDRETGEEWHPVLKKGSGNICDYKPLYAAPAAPAADAGHVFYGMDGNHP